MTGDWGGFGNCAIGCLSAVCVQKVNADQADRLSGSAFRFSTRERIMVMLLARPGSPARRAYTNVDGLAHTGAALTQHVRDPFSREQVH